MKYGEIMAFILFARTYNLFPLLCLECGVEMQVIAVALSATASVTTYPLPSMFP